MTSEGYFKNLDIDLLKSYAAQWVHDFDYVKLDKIELHRYTTPRSLTKHYKANSKILYAVVFYTKEIDVPDFISFALNDNSLWGDHPFLKGEKLTCRYVRRRWEEEICKCDMKRAKDVNVASPFEKFCREIGCRQTVPDQKYSALFGEDFKNVYQRGTFPGADYLDQWVFIPMAIGEGLPLSADNGIEPVVLYPASLKAPDGKYVFAETGPSWRISFNGETLDALKGKGFRTIYFLVSRPGQIFTPEELHTEITKGTEEVKTTPTERGFNDEIYDQRAMKELKEQYRHLKAELQSAKNDGDPSRGEKARFELENFEKFFLEGVKNGNAHHFVNNHTRLKKRYAKQIERALDKIKTYKTIHQHFYYALKPINSHLFSYEPSEEIDWAL